MKTNRAIFVASLVLPCAAAFATNAAAQQATADPGANAVTQPDELYSGLVSLYEGEARRGAEQALADMSQGTVQHVAIGEEAPSHHRDLAGLPVGSLGCEWDESAVEFGRGYNAVVDALVASAAPFDAFGTVEVHNGDDAVIVEMDRITYEGEPVTSEIHQRAALMFLAHTLVVGSDSVACGPDAGWQVVVGDESVCWTAGDETFLPMQRIAYSLLFTVSRDD